jgi:hypothetical protein
VLHLFGAGRLNSVERNRGPQTVDTMGILSSLAHPANGDTYRERACEEVEKHTDERWRWVRRLSVASRNVRDERRARWWTHKGRLLREDDHE